MQLQGVGRVDRRGLGVPFSPCCVFLANFPGYQCAIQPPVEAVIHFLELINKCSHLCHLPPPDPTETRPSGYPDVWILMHLKGIALKLHESQRAGDTTGFAVSRRLVHGSLWILEASQIHRLDK